MLEGIVVHLDEAGPDKHVSVLRNVGNLLDELGDGTEIELVTHGAGRCDERSTRSSDLRLRTGDL